MSVSFSPQALSRRLPSSAPLKFPPICSLNTMNCVSGGDRPLDEMAQQIYEGPWSLLAFSPAVSSSAQYSFYNISVTVCTLYTPQLRPFE